MKWIKKHVHVSLFAAKAGTLGTGADAKAKRLNRYQQVLDLVTDPYLPDDTDEAPCTFVEAQGLAQELKDEGR